MLSLQCVQIFTFTCPKCHLPVKESTSHAIMIRMHVRDSDFQR